MNAWILLAAAILLEICATSLLKASAGFTRPLHAVASNALYTLCFWLLAFAFTRIPMGVAYAIWSGVGIVGIALIGLFLFHQPLTLTQIAFMSLVAVGAVGLSLSTPGAGDVPIATCGAIRAGSRRVGHIRRRQRFRFESPSPRPGGFAAMATFPRAQASAGGRSCARALGRASS